MILIYEKLFNYITALLSVKRQSQSCQDLLILIANGKERLSNKFSILINLSTKYFLWSFNFFIYRYCGEINRGYNLYFIFLVVFLT